MKTETEIVLETLRYYGANPAETRAVNSVGGCEYITPDGRMCAVGRVLSLEGLRKAHGCGDTVEALANRRFNGDLDSGLKPEYRGHSLEFWTDLQFLHDDGGRWNNPAALAQRIRDYFPDAYEPAIAEGLIPHA